MKLFYHGNGYWERREAARFRSMHKKEIQAQEKLDLKCELARFWTHCNRLDMSAADRLKRLQEFSEIIISTPERGVRRHRRTHFVYSRCRRSKMCFGCDRPAWVRHHIIQIQFGGNNSKENIVTLCKDCHAEIHTWMKVGEKTPRTKLATVVNKSPKDVNNPTEAPEDVMPPQPAAFYSQSYAQDKTVPLNELVKDGECY